MASANSEEELITAVMNRPNLYQKRDPKYKNKIARENSWTQIEISVGRPGPDCKIEWDRLRGRYLKFLTKLVKPTGSGAGKRPYFRHENLMSFLKDCPEDESQNFSNVPDFSNPERDLEELENEALDNLVHSVQPSTSTPSVQTETSHNVSMPRSHKKYNGKRKLSEFDEKLIKIIKTEDTPDEWDLFCRTVSYKLRRINQLSPIIASDLQFDLYKMIHDKEKDLRDSSFHVLPNTELNLM